MSNSTTPEPTSPPELPGKPRNWKTIGLVIIVVAAVAAGAFLAYWFLMRPQTVWLFEGAYANYEGTTSYLTVEFEVTMRWELLEFNTTHAKVLTYMWMDSSITSPVEEQNITWVDLATDDFDVEGMALGQTYEDDVYIPNWETRHCEVYVYNAQGNPGAMTIYEDTATGWPIRFALDVSAYDLEIDLNIVDSNIPGLLD